MPLPRHTTADIGFRDRHHARVKVPDWVARGAPGLRAMREYLWYSFLVCCLGLILGVATLTLPMVLVGLAATAVTGALLLLVSKV